MLKSYSRKQAGVVFRNYKLGNVQASEEAIGWLYDLADAQSNYFDQYDIDMIHAIRAAVDAIFAGDMDEAQKMLDRFASIHEMHYC